MTGNMPMTRMSPERAAPRNPLLIIGRAGTRWLPVRVDDFEDWQTGLLEDSAIRLGTVPAKDGRVHGRRSVGSPVAYQGESAWLRVSPFLEHEIDRTAWRGTLDAASISGVRKPSLLAHTEWCTGGPAPALAAYPTDRHFRTHDAAEYRHLLGATYRRPTPAGAAPEFGTEHVDLAWGNISAPSFQIIDMEHWGIAVKGYGAAYLYLTSLGVPAVAARVHEALADLLDSPSGRYAQLVAAALILRNLTRLPDPIGLAAALHRHTDTLLG